MSIDWQPIETVPKRPWQHILGYDRAKAEEEGDPDKGVCLMYWVIDDMGEGEGFDAYWSVDFLHEMCGEIIDPDTLDLTHWSELPKAPIIRGN